MIAAGNSMRGSDFGSALLAIVTAASAACLTVVSTVLRVCRHRRLARVIDVSSWSPTNVTARDSTTVPSLTSVLNVLPASDCTQSLVTAAAPRLASHTWRDAARASSPNWNGRKLAVVFSMMDSWSGGWNGSRAWWRLTSMYRHCLEQTS